MDKILQAIKELEPNATTLAIIDKCRLSIGGAYTNLFHLEDKGIVRHERRAGGPERGFRAECAWFLCENQRGSQSTDQEKDGGEDSVLPALG
jgi:hypothetical protein